MEPRTSSSDPALRAHRRVVCSCPVLAVGQRWSSGVDPHLRVRGIERLRVIDASIMPTIISGKTNAATIAVAEKAAEERLRGHFRDW